MARAARSGDESYNARRRYTRAAQRNLKKAESATGATAARYRSLAKKDLENALGTYDSKQKQKISAPIRKLAREFGIDAEKRRSDLAKEDGEQRKKLISESTKSLESALQDPDIRREREARMLLNSKLGRRIIGGTEDIWREAASDDAGEIDREKILPSLFDYFEVDSVADLLEKIEEIVGDKLYAEEDADTMYEAVKLLIQIKTAGDNEYTE